MMFLLDAKRMTKGMARLRQILILAMRVLALLALIFAISRPLASGWVALTAGGAPDTVLVLLDRSASMEQQNLLTGESKRSTSLKKISDLIEKVGKRTRVVLIESVENRPIEIAEADNLNDLPATWPTDATADVAGMMQTALDYITVNGSGRTDVWLASDLRAQDWGPASGRWDSLRAAFASLEGVRFYLLNYPDVAPDNIAVTVENVTRLKIGDQAQLQMDIYLRRHMPNGEEPAPIEVPIEYVINGVRTADTVKLDGLDLALQGHTIPIGASTERGWGKISVPADSNPRDNSFYFVFDEAPSQKTVIVSDEAQVIEPIRAAVSSQIDPGRNYVAEVINPSRIAEIPWTETALLLWHTAIPEPGTPDGVQLKQFVESGKTVIFLPTDANPSASGFMGGNWGEWVPESTDAIPVGWWRTESDLLANTQNGDALPVGKLNMFRVRKFVGEEGQPLLKTEPGEPILTRVPTDTRGAIYFCGTLPSPSYSSLAREGVVFFVMLHRALDQGAKALANAQQRSAEGGLFAGDETGWKTFEISETSNPDETSLTKGLLAGAFENQTRKQLVAVNRSLDEDSIRKIDSSEIENLFSGLNYREIKDEVGDSSSLASEIWRAFLITMALALIIEAALCFPAKTEKKVVPKKKEAKA